MIKYSVDSFSRQFFSAVVLEMAERHNATQILDLARSSVRTVATLIQNE